MSYFITFSTSGDVFLSHGIEWKQHKYIRKEGNRYIYPEDAEAGTTSGIKAPEDSSDRKEKSDSKIQQAQTEYNKALIQFQLIVRASRENGINVLQDRSYLLARAEVLKAKAELDRLNAENIIKKIKKGSLNFENYKELPTGKAKKEQDRKARQERKSALQERLEYEAARKRRADERKLRK